MSRRQSFEIIFFGTRVKAEGILGIIAASAIFGGILIAYLGR